MTHSVDQEIIDKYPMPDGWVVEPGNSSTHFNVTQYIDKNAAVWYVYADIERTVVEHKYTDKFGVRRFPVIDAEDAVRLIQALILFGEQA